eukprot:scaffold10410_cov144-Isochrysis_galbana.AAC.2
MREGVQAFDAIIVNRQEAIQVTLARKCPPARPDAGCRRCMLQEEIPTFLQQLQEAEPREVLGVGVARVRAASGPRMMAWITYGGPDGADALGLEGGALFSYSIYNTEVRIHGNNRVKVVAYLRPMHNRHAQQMFA